MVIVHEYQYEDRVELVIDGTYIPSIKELYNHGFKYNKIKRIFRKAYYDKEYFNNMFERDLKLIRSLWDKEFKYRKFKCISEVKNY